MSTNTKEPSLFSLPEEIIVIILARVTRKYYPILSCVSKKLRSLLQSPELHKTRYLLGKHCFYVCLEESVTGTNHWFSLNENRLLEKISTPSLPEQSYSDVTMVGPEIYFLCGYNSYPKSLWILDPRSGKLRQGPIRHVSNCFNEAMGLVDEKIYVFGGVKTFLLKKRTSGGEKIQAQVFDLKTQTWQLAPTPSVRKQASVDQSYVPNGKIYARNPLGALGAAVMVYDPRDGKCDYVTIPDHYNYGKDVCVVNNVMYMCRFRVGLMWYDTKTQDWRLVHGLQLGVYLESSSMVEYNGKLMFLWQKVKQIWCAMIVPYVIGEEIHARLEWSKCIHSDVEYEYNIKHCLSRMD